MVLSQRPKDRIPTGAIGKRVLYGLVYRFAFYEPGKYFYLLYLDKRAREKRMKQWAGEAEELIPFTLELPTPEELKLGLR